MHGSSPSTSKSWSVSGANARLAWRASTRRLASLGLLIAVGLTACFALQGASLSSYANQVTSGGTAPEAADVLDGDSIGDGVLPLPMTAMKPVSPSFPFIEADLYPLPAAPQLIPHPPQVPVT